MQNNMNPDMQIDDIKSIENRIKNTFFPYIKSYEELEEKSVEDLIKLDGITFRDILCLVAIINAQGYHIIGEEKMNLSYFFGEPTRSLFLECEALVSERNMIRRMKDKEKDFKKKLSYANQAMELSEKIEEKLGQIDEIVLENKHMR